MERALGSPKYHLSLGTSDRREGLSGLARKDAFPPFVLAQLRWSGLWGLCCNMSLSLFLFSVSPKGEPSAYGSVS